LYERGEVRPLDNHDHVRLELSEHHRDQMSADRRRVPGVNEHPLHPAVQPAGREREKHLHHQDEGQQIRRLTQGMQETVLGPAQCADQ
jgi:hypothetical protein